MAVRVIPLLLCVMAVSGCEKLQRFYYAEPWKWSASGLVETKRRGDLVCHAIDAYHAKTGRYPSRLEDLEPEFLNEIPKPTVGYKQWQYMVIDQGANYWLHVVASEFGPSLDKNAGAQWQYRQ